jgi:hypothetical protein
VWQTKRDASLVRGYLSACFTVLLRGQHCLDKKPENMAKNNIFAVEKVFG